MVFQNYALYPHMSVYDNMAFGLKLRKFPKQEIQQRVQEAAELLGIQELLQRKPRALSGGLEPRPGQAYRWEVSPDGLTYTFHLRPGIRWSDGAPVTSEDIKFTWEAIVNPKNLMKSRSGYDLIESVRTPDAQTAVVKYKEFYAPYLTRFSPLLPKHVLANLPQINDAPYNRKPIGTGPFMVSEWASGNHITMIKNPHYWDASKVKIDKLIFKILNNGLDNPAKHDQARQNFEQMLAGKNNSGITERALRYDLSIPFARYVAMNHGKLSFPFKRYQVQPV